MLYKIPNSNEYNSLILELKNVFARHSIEIKDIDGRIVSKEYGGEMSVSLDIQEW